MVNKYPGLCFSSTMATVPLGGPLFLMLTLGTLRLWEVIPKPVGSSLGSCAFPHQDSPEHCASLLAL